jgi:hypothetical protein
MAGSCLVAVLHPHVVSELFSCSKYASEQHNILLFTPQFSSSIPNATCHVLLEAGKGGDNECVLASTAHHPDLKFSCFYKTLCAFFFFISWVAGPQQLWSIASGVCNRVNINHAHLCTLQ